MSKLAGMLKMGKGVETVRAIFDQGVNATMKTNKQRLKEELYPLLKKPCLASILDVADLFGYVWMRCIGDDQITLPPPGTGRTRGAKRFNSVVHSLGKLMKTGSPQGQQMIPMRIWPHDEPTLLDPSRIVDKSINELLRSDRSVTVFWNAVDQMNRVVNIETLRQILYGIILPLLRDELDERPTLKQLLALLKMGGFRVPDIAKEDEWLPAQEHQHTNKEACDTVQRYHHQVLYTILTNNQKRYKDGVLLREEVYGHVALNQLPPADVQVLPRLCDEVVLAKFNPNTLGVHESEMMQFMVVHGYRPVTVCYFFAGCWCNLVIATFSFLCLLLMSVRFSCVP